MQLSYRMEQIAACVTPGNRLADVGTDHGFIPIALVLRNTIPSAIALDVGEGPLTRAREHILQYGLEERICCRQSDGLAGLLPEETDSIVIAGMGGGLMSRILSDAKPRFCANKEFILQPQSEYDRVRRTLHWMGYRIVEERFFQDAGKYYNVIHALPGQEKYFREIDYLYGRVLLTEQNPVLQQYLIQRGEKHRKIIEQIRVQNQTQNRAQNRVQNKVQNKAEDGGEPKGDSKVDSAKTQKRLGELTKACQQIAEALECYAQKT